MTASKSILLHEEILLLALKDKEGTIISGVMYQHAIGGAILAELLLNERIALEEVKKKQLLYVVDTTPLGDPLIDEALANICRAKRRGSLQTWVSRLSGLRNIKERVALGLVKRGILRDDEENFLLIFNRKIYPEVNPEPERRLIERLRNAIFSDSEDIDPHTVVLLSLAQSAEILKFHFDKKQLRSRKDRIDKIINGEMTGKATKEAIQAMRAAVMVACIMPAVIVASTAGH